MVGCRRRRRRRRSRSRAEAEALSRRRGQPGRAGSGGGGDHGGGGGGGDGIEDGAGLLCRRSPSPPRPSAATLAARAALRGASTVSVSAPGVLLRECEGGGLEAGATPRAGAVEALRALASAASGGVFLVCRVVGDVGEAAARGALEAAGAVGPPPAPVPPQRLLFCETAGGKIAAVRALEPGLHVDAEPGTLDGLARFVPRLALVNSQSAASCDGGGGNGDGGGGGVPPLAAAAVATEPPARRAGSGAAPSADGASPFQQLGDGRWPSAPSLAALLGLAG